MCQKLQYKHYNGKKQTAMGRRCGIFRGIGEIASGFSRGLIKKNVKFSRCDQVKNYVEFPGVLVLGLKNF